MTVARTVIFVHGAGGGGWEWTIWSRVFMARGWHVVAPNLHAAAAGLAVTRLADYIAQVRGWCAPYAQPVLIGASLGARLVLATSDIAAALVLINPLLPKTSFVPRSIIVPWGSYRSFENTRCAMPDADDAACLFAHRRWGDEAGAVLNEAFATPLPLAQTRHTLVFASEFDADTPMTDTCAWAQACGAEFRLVPGASHVGPLLGRAAARCAELAADWLSNTS